MIDVLAFALMLAGVFFLFVAAVGFVRLPDVFCRLHITGVIDTLGVPLVLLGIALHLGWQLTSIKLVLGVIFLFGTSPLVGHLLAASALRAGYSAAPETIGSPDDEPEPATAVPDSGNDAATNAPGQGKGRA